jgi:hypothetical protein
MVRFPGSCCLRPRREQHLTTKTFADGHFASTITRMTTVKFNVGGKEFMIAREHVYKSEKLMALAEYHFSDGAIFLDHNYDAFAIVLDYLRYNKILIPPSVNAKTVQLILEDLCIHVPSSQRAALTINGTAAAKAPPPQYSQVIHEDKRSISLADTKTRDGMMDTASLASQLANTVHQKITDLIITTIRPRITSQARLGAYRTTYVLLPAMARNGSLMSEFPKSNFTEMVYLEGDVEKFLGQPEVLWKFEVALKDSLEVPITMNTKDVFYRSENEFGVYNTETIQAVVIEFELGRRL